MSDVITKIIENNSINDGSIIVSVNQFGVYSSLNVEDNLEITSVESELTNRYDDVTGNGGSLLVGVAGGQTIIGGTNPTDELTLYGNTYGSGDVNVFDRLVVGHLGSGVVANQYGNLFAGDVPNSWYSDRNFKVTFATSVASPTTAGDTLFCQLTTSGNYTASWNTCNLTQIFNPSSGQSQGTSANSAWGPLFLSTAFRGTGGTVVRAAGVRSSFDLVNNQTNVTAFYLSDLSGARSVASNTGVITNLYGQRIASLKASYVTNAYGIVQEGVNDRNIFLGPTAFSGGLTVSPGSLTGVPLVVKGFSSQGENIQEWRDSSNNVYSTISESGYFTTRRNIPPADAELQAGEAAWYFDSTDGAARIIFKGKTANGTVVSGIYSMI